MAKSTAEEPMASEPFLERTTVFVIVGVLLVALALSMGKLFQTNDVGHYQVKQAAFTGNMSVKNEAGIYLQMFGKITDYPITGLIEFSADGQGKGDPFKATFRGNSTADISGIMKFQLSPDSKDQLLLNERYGSASTVQETLVRQALAEAIKQTGPLFSPEEAFVLKRSEFTKISREMLRRGIFKTYTEEVDFRMEDGTKRTETVTKISLDKSGNPIVDKPSTLLDYNIQVIDFTIRDFKFDETTTDLIDTKKKAEQEKVVARANAEKAKQDTITAFEQGKATVAKAEAEQNVIKVKSVVEAQKNFEVAKFQKLQAEQEAKSKILQGEAEAAVSRLKVSAGLSPLEKAEIEMKTRIGVAEQIAKMKWPDHLIIAGGGKDGQFDPVHAIGLNNLYDLSEKQSKKVGQ